MITIIERLQQDADGVFAEKYAIETRTYGFLFRDWLNPGALIASVDKSFPVGISVAECVPNDTQFQLGAEVYPPNTAILLTVTGGVSGTDYSGTVTLTTNEIVPEIKTFRFKIKVL